MKPNALIQARYSFQDIHEYRLYTSMLMEVYRGEDPFRSMNIPIETVLGPTKRKLSEKDHVNLRRAAKNITERNVNLEVYEPKYFDYIPLVFRAKYQKEDQADKVIRTQFHPDVIPVIEDMFEKGYTKWFLMYSNRLRSFYSVRMYELLKQYERFGARPVHGKNSESTPLHKLRWWLSLDGANDAKPKFKRYSNFKQKILLKAQDDLKKYTDIAFEFEEDKEFGDPREVSGLWFYIKKNIPTIDGCIQTTLPFNFEEFSLENMRKNRFGHYTSGFYGDFKEKVKNYKFDYIEYYYKMARDHERRPNHIRNGFWDYFKGLLENDPDNFETMIVEKKKKELEGLKKLEEAKKKETEQEKAYEKAEINFKKLPKTKQEKYLVKVPPVIKNREQRIAVAVGFFMQDKDK